MMGKFNGKKEKWTNKVTDKQYVADFLINITTCHTKFQSPMSSSS